MELNVATDWEKYVVVYDKDGGPLGVATLAGDDYFNLATGVKVALMRRYLTPTHEMPDSVVISRWHDNIKVVCESDDFIHNVIDVTKSYGFNLGCDRSAGLWWQLESQALFFHVKISMEA